LAFQNHADLLGTGSSQGRPYVGFDLLFQRTSRGGQVDPDRYRLAINLDLFDQA